MSILGYGTTKLDMDWIHLWIELDWIGWDDCDPVFFKLVVTEVTVDAVFLSNYDL